MGASPCAWSPTAKFHPTEKNPFSTMATPPSPALQAMIDAYRSADARLKENIGKQQTLDAQLTENNMVASELDAVKEGEPVYKLQGKILVLHDVTEAKATVGQRITMIQGEMCVRVRARAVAQAPALLPRARRLPAVPAPARAHPLCAPARAAPTHPPPPHPTPLQ